MLAWLQRLLSRVSRRTRQQHAARVPVLAVSSCYVEQLAIRIASSKRNWNLVVCPTFEIAIRARRRARFSVILYDLDVSGIEWRHGIHELLMAGDPVCVIAFSSRLDDALWETAIGCGAYDLQKKPLNENRQFAHSVEEAHALIVSQALSDLWDRSPSLLP